MSCAVSICFNDSLAELQFDRVLHHAHANSGSSGAREYGLDSILVLRCTCPLPSLQCPILLRAALLALLKCFGPVGKLHFVKAFKSEIQMPIQCLSDATSSLESRTISLDYLISNLCILPGFARRAGFWRCFEDSFLRDYFAANQSS